LIKIRRHFSSILLVLSAGSLCAVRAQKPVTHTTWTNYGGTADSAQYSDLSQINKSNVGQLTIAWKYATGDGSKYLFNPIVVDRVMYVLAKNNSIVALDATTGNPLWVHATDQQSKLLTSRGINYWESADRSIGVCFFR